MESADSIFAVGGSIPLTEHSGRNICDSDEVQNDTLNTTDIEDTADDDSSTLGDHEMRCDPVTIRWDSTSDSGCEVKLPYKDADKPKFEQLLKDCAPASFGRGGADVVDETYRKAGKLDCTEFSSDFNPYALELSILSSRH